MRNPNRVLPHNIEAEESLLGAMLLSKTAIDVAAEFCSAQDFYKPAHGHIYEGIISLWSRGEPIDSTTVADELKRADLLEVIGGPTTLLSLQMDTPASSNAERYAKIVSDYALLRKLVTTGGEISELGFSLPDDVAQTIDQAESLMFEIGQSRITDSGADIKVLLSRALDRIESLYDNDKSITGIPTGFYDFDEKVSGLHGGRLYILGARPAMGKSSWALNVVANAAEAGTPTLFFTLEMSADEVTTRLISSEARVDAKRLQNGQLNDQDWPKVNHAIGRLGESMIRIEDNARVTVMDIRAKARRMKASPTGLGLVVVDYIQLMAGRGKAENRQIEVSEISRGLKILARELDVPILALSQLSRGLEARADKRPILADLRESGSLEQDADVVMFLYRDEVYNPQDTVDKGTAELIIAKHRQGPIGTIQMAFIDRYTRFANMARV